jgi:uncharacterized Fe-S cluster protein YjdI/CDGSH-type Zn-finger protein
VTGDPAIVVERRKELTYLLSQGAELEHAVMCQYLYAAFSLKSTEGPGLRSDQLEAVERWRRVLLDIAAEEMLHWAVVQNLLTAVGSAPFVSRPHFPAQAHGYPPEVQFRLLPFGDAALQHFIYLERPEGADQTDAAAFEHTGPRPAPMSPEEVVPRGQDFDTQGHLYRAVERGLAHLTDLIGEDRLFIGPAFHQAEEASFGWPYLQPITDLQSAKQALERIVEQGEGATGDWETAHYGRFLAVLSEYQEMREADPDFDPVHPVVAAGMREVEGVAPDVYISDPDTGGCSDLFNSVNELLLQMIARYFAFGHETSEQREVLASTAVGLMFRAIKPLGLLLARLPVGPDHPGVTAGANFQLPYRASFLLPHRRSAWIRYAERLDELAAFADGLHPATGGDVLPAVSAALAEGASDLMAHVEAVGKDPVPRVDARREAGANDPTEAGVPRTKGAVRTYENDDIRVHWDASRCVHTAICLRTLPSVFAVEKRPWIDIDGSDAEQVAAAVRKCPTTALRYEGLSIPDEEPDEPTTVEVRPNGALWLRGRVQLKAAGHDPETVEDYRVALCRCGASQNKPFCDNSHRLIGFRDHEPQ